jgi:hypothetical protein
MPVLIYYQSLVYMCVLMFKVLCLRAGRPRPYLDKKFSVVQVGAGFSRPVS